MKTGLSSDYSHLFRLFLLDILNFNDDSFDMTVDNLLFADGFLKKLTTF